MKIRWLLVLLALIFGLFWFSTRTVSQTNFSLASSFNTDFAYDNRTFLPSVALHPPRNSGLIPSVLIVPHHLTASSMIAQGISLLTSKPPETIIILSPNHQNTGQCDIVTSKNNWNTPFGPVSVDVSKLDLFLEAKIVCLDDDALIPEHGIAGLLPFIKYYLPNAKVIPFALKKEINPSLSDNFTQELISLSSNTVIVASIDFSHGLSRTEALKRDDITQDLINNLDYPGILKLSSEYLDSPFSLVSILKVMTSQHIQLQFLLHQDSSDFNGLSSEVTSYYLITGEKLSDLSEPFTLIFGGDVMLGRSVNTRMIKYSDFSWPFRKISHLLSESNLSMVNLESPIRSGCLPTDQGMIFCADPRSVEGLLSAGIDVVNLANNHINNQGQEGINETVSLLSQANIAQVGQSQPYLTSINGTRIAFLGFTDINPESSVISRASRDNIKTQITQAKNNSDLIITNFHWGNEYSQHSLRQVELAHLAIDSGADVVIGHHPHWIQAVEQYQGKPIYYSLGNLVFDQMWSEATRKGLLVRLTFSGENLLKQEQIPIKIFDYGQPVLEN